MNNNDDQISNINDIKLFSHIIVMGIDTNQHGFSFILFNYIQQN